VNKRALTPPRLSANDFVMAQKNKNTDEIKTPPAHDWRTTDDDEVNRRRVRAREESFTISNREPRHPIFSSFTVRSGSGMAYTVEIRDVAGRRFYCDCVDFRVNGLGTCKHAEAVLLHLEGRFGRLLGRARQAGSPRVEIVVDGASGALRVVAGHGEFPPALRAWFGDDGRLAGGSPEEAVEAATRLRDDGHPEIRVSLEVEVWLENRRRMAERKSLRREYEIKVQNGEWPPQETNVPLFPYQREGMLHLAFTERALLADEMGLGKTIQAIAACALLRRLGKARRVLVVTPASLKTEWEEQIGRVHLPPGALGLRLPASSRRNLCPSGVRHRGIALPVLRGRQLRASPGRRRGHQPSAAPGYSGVGRGPAYQKLGDKNRAGD
jgi:hypothetical protein